MVQDRPSVLIVDDSALVRSLVTRVLRDHLVVEGVADGAAALERLAMGARYDAVLVDLSMPGIGGAELFSVVRERFPDLAPRIVFLTGGASSPEDERFVRTVTNPVLKKPFANEELRALLVRTATGHPSP